MTKQLVTLSVLDVEQILGGKIAWSVAQLITDADSDVRLAKGKFWNRCERGTREKICDAFGWKYKTMQEYAQFADDLSVVTDISYTHWNNSRKAGVQKEDRPAFLEKATARNWTPRQVTIEAEKLSKKTVKLERKPITLKDMEEASDDQEPISPAGAILSPDLEEVTLQEACVTFGLDEIYWISKETLGVLYKHYAKKFHPDKGGKAKDMDRLIKANTKLKEIAR